MFEGRFEVKDLRSAQLMAAVSAVVLGCYAQYAVEDMDAETEGPAAALTDTGSGTTATLRDSPALITRATRTRRTAPVVDPVAAYQAAGGAMPEFGTAGMLAGQESPEAAAPETAWSEPASTAGWITAVSNAPAAVLESAATAADATTTTTTTDSPPAVVDRAALTDKFRTSMMLKGAIWLRENVLDKYKVTRGGDLTDSQMIEVLANV
jgi:hypothetical protein